VISADDVGKQVVEDDPGVLERLVSAFGNEILDSNGKLDRRATGRVAFSSKKNLQMLDDIVHPALLRQLRAKVGSLGRPGPHSCIVVDAALILHWHIQSEFDVLICVIAPEESVIERLVQQGHSAEEVRQRLDMQIPAEDQAAAADYVIRNDSSLEVLREKAQQLYERIFGEENTV
jgi:dephospho-CoA kinase